MNEINSSKRLKFAVAERADGDKILQVMDADPEKMLDADPAHGSMHEPFLKLVRVMMSLDFQTESDQLFVQFSQNLQDIIGQQPHTLPSVFSFFLPEHSSAGRIHQLLF